MNMDDYIYNRVCESAPEVKWRRGLNQSYYKDAISLAYIIGKLDGGAEAKDAIDVFFARKEIEAQK
jgi:hypothetical protein